MGLTPFGLTGALSTAAVCLYAIWRGGRPERLGALTLTAALVAISLLQDRASWLDPQWRITLIDLSEFGMFAYLVQTSSRRWTLHVAAFQLLSVCVDLLHRLDPRIGARAYLTLNFALGYAVLGAFGRGVWLVSMPARRATGSSHRRLPRD